MKPYYLLSPIGFSTLWGVLMEYLRSFTLLKERRFLLSPRSGELRTHKLKSHLMRTQSLNVLPFKPGVGQYIALHATLTAWDFLLPCLFLPFQSIYLHFFQNLSQSFPVLACSIK